MATQAVSPAAASGLPAALQSPIRWPAEAIWQAVAPSLPGFTVEVLPEIDSSNTELMRRFRTSPDVAPQADAVLLVAEQQTAGRGRLGRSWQSRRGDSLTFSLGMPLQPADWSGLSLVVGISLAESLDAYLAQCLASPTSRNAGVNTGTSPTPPSPTLGIKWPNDVWTGSGTNSPRKLAGILVETAHRDAQRYAVMGIGINIRPVELHTPDAAAPGATPISAGCLHDLAPGADAASVLLAVVPALVQNILAFAQFGFAPFQARFAQRDVLAGRAVQILGGQPPDAPDAAHGTAHGVSENGALLVHTPAGMKAITSSEVSIRPLATGTDTGAAPAC